jgi:hypothetical protein
MHYPAQEAVFTMTIFTTSSSAAADQSPADDEFFLAIETEQPDLFTCLALGRGVYSEAQLREWAEHINVPLVILRRHG